MQDNLVLILGSVMIAVVVALLVFFIYKKMQPGKASNGRLDGREHDNDKAVGALKGFTRSNDFRLIAPAYITSNGLSAKLDGVAVGYFGVLGLISLGYDGQIYGEASEKTWVQVGDNDQRNRFDNPILEASAAVRTLRDVLFTNNLKKVPVEVVYVFSNPKAQLALPRSIAPMRLREFKSALKRDRYLDDTGLDLDKVEAALKSAVKK